MRGAVWGATHGPRFGWHAPAYTGLIGAAGVAMQILRVVHSIERDAVVVQPPGAQRLREDARGVTSINAQDALRLGVREPICGKQGMRTPQS